MKKAFKLNGLDCANCAAKIEKAIKAIDGVTSASLNFITAKLIIEGDDAKFDDIVKSANAIVNKFEPDVIVKKV
jgi:copper chaperone CopZ